MITMVFYEEGIHEISKHNFHRFKELHMLELQVTTQGTDWLLSPACLFLDITNDFRYVLAKCA